MEQRSTQHQLDKQKKNDWFLRFFKGMFIGSGFILPGVSGGALAAIFGLYERMIAFLANVTKDFKKNFLFFLPVGIGALAGIVVLSFGVSYFLETSKQSSFGSSSDVSSEQSPLFGKKLEKKVAQHAILSF